jgi:hypothetical protein
MGLPSTYLVNSIVPLLVDRVHLLGIRSLRKRMSRTTRALVLLQKFRVKRAKQKKHRSATEYTRNQDQRTRNAVS